MQENQKQWTQQELNRWLRICKVIWTLYAATGRLRVTDLPKEVVTLRQKHVGASWWKLAGAGSSSIRSLISNELVKLSDLRREIVMLLQRKRGRG